MSSVRALKQACLAVAAILCATPALSSDFELLKLNGEYVKWGAPSFGTGAEVSYSYVRDAMQFPEARNCRAMVSPDAMLEKSGMSFEAFDATIHAAFAQWASAANVRFHYVKDPHRANIVIGAQAEPTGIAFTNVVPSETLVLPADKGRVAAMQQSSVCFNPTLVWSAAAQPPADHGRDLFLVAGHEIGHALGLDHPGPRGAMMAFREEYATRDLQGSDIDAIRTLYGAPCAKPQN